VFDNTQTAGVKHGLEPLPAPRQPSRVSSKLLPSVLLGQTGSYTAVAGDTYRALVTGAQSGGAFIAMEILVRPGGGPPYHVHHREDETFYILEGEIEFTLDGKKVRAAVGSCVFAPRDIPHTFKNVSDKIARFVVFITPAGLENFFAAISKPLASREAAPPPVTPDEVQKLLALAPQYGLEILPPPA